MTEITNQRGVAVARVERVLTGLGLLFGESDATVPGFRLIASAENIVVAVPEAQAKFAVEDCGTYWRLFRVIGENQIDTDAYLNVQKQPGRQGEGE